MNLDLKEITFVIVSYKASKVIFNCINSLPKFSKIIVVENSYDQELKKELEAKYDNIEVLLNENIGMGASNNVGIKKSTTKYVFILNPNSPLAVCCHISDPDVRSPFPRSNAYVNIRLQLLPKAPLNALPN